MGTAMFDDKENLTKNGGMLFSLIALISHPLAILLHAPCYGNWSSDGLIRSGLLIS